MSYFGNGVVYIIVPTIDVSNEMINNTKVSFSSTVSSLRKSIDLTLTLFKTKSPVSGVFNGYAWYNYQDINPVLDSAEWSDPGV